MGLRLSRSVGRPSLYPPNTEMTALKVPKHLKEKIQLIGIEIAWGRIEEARRLIDE